ncbi:hypothetical protein ACVW0P_000649 [Mucilaginibacter sp. UYNi724]
MKGLEPKTKKPNADMHRALYSERESNPALSTLIINNL